MIRVVLPSLHFFQILYPIPDPGSGGQKGTGCRIRVSNTAYEIIEFSNSVVDRHRFDADPDPTFHIDADPDPDPA